MELELFLFSWDSKHTEYFELDPSDAPLIQILVLFENAAHKVLADFLLTILHIHNYVGFVAEKVTPGQFFFFPVILILPCYHHYTNILYSFTYHLRRAVFECDSAAKSHI
jgi:hypothetical protein